jgi:hypothetical protein
MFDAVKEGLFLYNVEQLTAACRGLYSGPLHLGHLGEIEEWHVSDVLEVTGEIFAATLDCKIGGTGTCSRRMVSHDEHDWSTEFTGTIDFRLLLSLLVWPDDPPHYSWELADIMVELGADWE